MAVASVSPAASVFIKVFTFLFVFLGGTRPSLAKGLLEMLREAQPKARPIIRLDNITISAGPVGYAVINLVTPGCRGGEDYGLNVISCDGEARQATMQGCKEVEDGALLCLGLVFENKTCVQVMGGEVTSNQVTLLPFTMRVVGVPTETGWIRGRNSNVSVMTVTKHKAAPAYSMDLLPQPHQPLPHQVAGEESELACAAQETVALVGDVSGDYVTFSADWNSLDKNCRYMVTMTPKNYCEGDIYSKFLMSDLNYTFPTTAQEQAAGGGGDPVLSPSVLVVLALIMAVCVLAMMKIIWIRKNIRAIGGCRSMAMKDAKQSPLARTVLLVYARDVQEMVQHLMERLRKETSHEILDLYDPGHIDKVQDPSVWLIKRFHDPDTLFIIVGSKVAKETQGGQQQHHHHHSTVHSGHSVRGQEVGEPEVLLGNGEGAHVTGLEFLLVDTLQELKHSHLAQDYKRVFAVKFTRDPGQVKLDYVTPGRWYDLPDHAHHLIGALNSP